MALTDNLDKAIKDIEVKFKGGLSNTSTNKFNDLSIVVAEITGLPEDDIYITSVFARASNTWNRLSQGKPLSRHYRLAVCIASPDGVNGVLAPLGSFIGDGYVHYDNIAVIAQDTDSVWRIKAIATNAKDDTSIKCQDQFPDAFIKLVNPVQDPVEEVVKRSINPDEATTPSHVSATSGGGFDRSDILAAIRTKPFILLAGISGTGKSRMLRQLARGCCPEWKDETKTQKHPLYNEQKPGNFEMIQVRPNWHDSTQLMGYVSRISENNKPQYVLTDFVRFLAKAWLFPDVPFFLCLDEMNLAPVEQYFAEYLSVVETRSKSGTSIVTDVLVRFPPEVCEAAADDLFKPFWSDAWKDKIDAETVKAAKAALLADGGLRIPQNFIVMGTVNMDETTFSFSRKVLDRAMSFELNEVDMDGGLAANPDCKFGSIDAVAAKCEFTQGFEVYAVAQADCDTIKAFLVEVNKVLDKTPFKIAYRTRNEIMIYCHERMKYGVPLAQALDEVTSMKILSRVEGDKRRLVVRDADLAEYNGKPLLESLLDVILKGLKTVRGGDADYTESAVCSRKLTEMSGQLENGYTSFWTR